MNDGTAFFSCRGVARTFVAGDERLEVLKDVTFDVAEGDFLAVRGLSGCGKSTLLHLMGLLDRPTAGEIRFLGEELAAAPDSRRNQLRAVDLAFVFQFYYLLPEFTALENVMMPALIAAGAGAKHRAPESRADRRARAVELLERVGLGGRLHHQPHALSGGERQRTAIARALMNRPRIVFCDEPTGNLDPKNAAAIHRLFSELNAALKQTFVVVTHDPRMAAAAARRVYLHDGRILPEGVELGAEDGEIQAVVG